MSAGYMLRRSIVTEEQRQGNKQMRLWEIVGLGPFKAHVSSQVSLVQFWSSYSYSEIRALRGTKNECVQLRVLTGGIGREKEEAIQYCYIRILYRYRYKAYYYRYIQSCHVVNSVSHSYIWLWGRRRRRRLFSLSHKHVGCSSLTCSGWVYTHRLYGKAIVAAAAWDPSVCPWGPPFRL